MSLLTLIQNAFVEIGFSSPTQAFNSPDQSTLQMIALANREGNILMGKYNWAALQKRNQITIVAGQDTYALPADFDRPINRTFWDQSNRWQMIGSVSPQEWEWIKSGITTVTPRRRWRIFGSSSSTFNIDPVPGAGDAGQILVFEYISNYWCKSPLGVGQSKWMTDDDVGILSEDLMTMGVKWRFLAAEGLAYQDDKEIYESAVKTRYAQEIGAPVLNIAGFGLYSGIPYPNSSDGNFGL